MMSLSFARDVGVRGQERRVYWKMSGYEKMTVDVLRQELRRRNLPSSGRKPEIVSSRAMV